MYRTFTRLRIRSIGIAARRWLLGSAAGRGCPLAVSWVDDPVRPVRLIRAVGTIDLASIYQVVRSWEHVSAPYLVHLDVQDAAIADAVAMSRLEAALDCLEQRQVDVRIVGLDPHHPALAC